MFRRNTIVAILALALFTVGAAYSQSLEENWNDFLHYTKIGHFDLAKGYARVIIDGKPDPVALLALSEDNLQGYTLLLRVKESASDIELVELSNEILEIIEQGRFIRRADPGVIVGEIKRLTSSTQQGRLAAIRRLQNSGEYAIMHMIDVIANTANKEELARLIWALPQIGRDSIRPLVAALQTDNVGLKAEIIKALGKIGYPQALAYLKYVIEKSDSVELRGLAVESIKEIDTGALNLPAAHLFYVLAENYYYHASSLAPAEGSDFANIWFWDADNRRLYRQQVDKRYFNELMAMRACEWSLNADPGFGKAIGLWQAAYFKAEAVGIKMPDYFGPNHAGAGVFATTIGPEYLHQALARAIKDNDAYIAFGAIEALANIAGEKSLMYRYGPAQPLVQALSFDDKAVRYSAAIAIAAAGPKEEFEENVIVAENLAAALTETSEGGGQSRGMWSSRLADKYALRAAKVMLKLAQSENPVIDLAVAQNALINATKDKRTPIKLLAATILASFETIDAQQAIAAMAFDESNAMDVRISAFDSLAASAKFNANLLDTKTINAIYLLISSQDVAPELRSAAAAAFGALNLPSEKVKDLILDQAKS